MPAPTYTHDFGDYPIDQLQKGETVLGRFPALAAYPVLAEHGAGEGDALLRFAFFYAHKGSALQHIGEIGQKQREALRLAGLEGDPRAAQMLAWRHRATVLLTDAVIEMQHSLKYGQWFYGTIMAWQTIKMLPVPIEGEQLATDLPPDLDPATAKLLASLMGKADELAEDKKQRAYVTKNLNFTALDAQIEKLDKLRAELFMSDEQLAEAARREKLAAAGSVGARASEQKFVTGNRKIQ